MRRLPVAAAAFAALALVPTAHAWTWPASGEVLKPFVYGGDPYAGGQHRGIDVAGEREEAVFVPASGIVTFAGTVGANGKVVTVETAGGHAVTLVHLGSIAVKKGDAVREGGVIGSIGPSGTPEHDVPYVHLGVRVASDPNGYVDPLTLLPPRAAPAPPAPPPPAPSPQPAPSPAPAPAPAACTAPGARTATAACAFARAAARTSCGGAGGDDCSRRGVRGAGSRGGTCACARGPNQHDGRVIAACAVSRAARGNRPLDAGQFVGRSGPHRHDDEPDGGRRPTGDHAGRTTVRHRS